jgi:cytochrome c6
MNTMRKLFVTLLLAISLCFSLITPNAVAADLATGAKVFSANCAACHAGGNNVVAAPKTLKADALKANGFNSAADIVAQVTNGKGAMPSFKGRLTPEQIEAVAEYVLDKSANGWS